jgi:hypothetical protein
MNNLFRENVLQPMLVMKQAKANMDDLEFAEIFHREQRRLFAEKNPIVYFAVNGRDRSRFRNKPGPIAGSTLVKVVNYRPTCHKETV